MAFSACKDAKGVYNSIHNLNKARGNKMVDFTFQELEMGQQYMAGLVAYKLDDVFYYRDIEDIFELSFEDITAKKLALRGDDDKVYISNACDAGEINEFSHGVNFHAGVYLIDDGDWAEMRDYFKGNLD